MTLPTKFNQESVTVTSNKGENAMNSKINPMNYPICASVRTDGTDLYIDTDDLLQYLHLNHRDFRRLRERGLLHGHFKTVDDFPSPVLIKGRNYWNLSEIRNWEIDQARYLQECQDIRSFTRAAENAMTESLETLQSRLLLEADISESDLAIEDYLVSMSVDPSMSAHQD